MKEQLNYPVSGYILLPPSQVPGYRGVDRIPALPFIPLLIEGEMDPAYVPEGSSDIWRFYPPGWRREAYKLYEENLAPGQDETDPFLLANLEAAHEIRRIIEPHVGFHEIFFCEIWDEHNPAEVEQPIEKNFLGYDIASCGGEFWSIILHGLFELDMEVRGSIIELNPPPSLVVQYRPLLNEQGLFSSVKPIPTFIQRYKQEVPSDANARFSIFRLLHVG